MYRRVAKVSVNFSLHFHIQKLYIFRFAKFCFKIEKLQNSSMKSGTMDILLWKSRDRHITFGNGILRWRLEEKK